MVAIPKISKRVETSLASKLSAAGTSFTLESATDEDGNALDGLYGMTIDVGNSNVEDFVVTISDNTATVVFRGIDADDPLTEVTANKKAHRRGAPVVITDFPILAYLRNILNGESGYTLPNPLRYEAGVGPVNASDLVDKEYADGLAISGAGLASEGTAGLVEEATTAQIDSDEGNGDDVPGARIFVNPQKLATSKYGTQLPSAGQKAALAGKSGTALSSGNKVEDEADTSSTSSANKLVRAGSDAKIDTGFIKTSKKLFLSTTEVTFTNGDGGAGAGNEQTLFSTTIPGGTLSTNNGIRFKIFIRDLNIDEASGSYVFKVKYGGSTQLTLSVAAHGTDMTSLDGFLEGYILADGATNVQKMTAVGNFAANEGETAGALTVELSKFHISANAAGSINSTADQTLAITLQQSNNSANDCVVEWCVIESIA